MLPSASLVSESTLEAPVVADPEAPDPTLAPESAPWTLRGFMRAHPWWTTAVAVVIVAAILVVWARTRPSFDAFGWLVWGHQTLHAALDLGGAPSWKPLPYLFTVPFALAGHYQLWLWMLFSVAVALGGAVFAGRIAYRLSGGGDPPPGGASSIDRFAPIAAAIFAGAAVLGLQDYFHYILSVQTDPMLVTLTLGAIDCISCAATGGRWCSACWRHWDAPRCGRSSGCGVCGRGSGCPGCAGCSWGERW